MLRNESVESDVAGCCTVSLVRRLGNLALLHAKGNSDLKSLPFAEKRTIYADSPYELTSQIATLDEWNPAAITGRQRKMAEYALQAWPLSAD